MALALTTILAGCSSSTEDEPTSLSPEEGTSGPEETTSPDEETTTPAEETSEPETTEPAEDETDESTDEATDEDSGPAFTLDATQSSNFPNLLGQFLATSARVGGHDTYDRVVIEYDGTEGELNWSANYEDAPIQDGSGFEVDMAGEEFLTIWVSGVRYPTEEEMTDAEFPITGLNQSSIIEDVVVDGPFEGMHTIFIGTDARHPYRVQVFDNPTRIVVDIEK